MKIVIGADHGGFLLKEELKAFICGLGHEVVDYGTYSKEAVDYPDFALLVAEAIASGRSSYGIMIDGTGIASAIAANKVTGIRATPCNDLFTAKSSREHNDANMLTIGASVVASSLAKEIVRLWLATEFGGERHRRRLQKIQEIEQKYRK